MSLTNYSREQLLDTIIVDRVLISNLQAYIKMINATAPVASSRAPEPFTFSEIVGSDGMCMGLALDFLSEIDRELFYDRLALLASWDGKEDSLANENLPDSLKKSGYKTLQEVMNQLCSDLALLQTTEAALSSVNAEKVQPKLYQRRNFISNYPIIGNRTLVHPFEVYQEFKPLNYPQLVQLLKIFSRFSGMRYDVSIKLPMDDRDPDSELLLHAVGLIVNETGGFSYYNSRDYYQPLKPFPTAEVCAAHFFRHLMLQSEKDGKININFDAYKFYDKNKPPPPLEKPSLPIQYEQGDQNPCGFTNLHLAILFNDVNKVKELLLSDRNSLAKKDNLGEQAYAYLFWNRPLYIEVVKMSPCPLSFLDPKCINQEKAILYAVLTNDITLLNELLTFTMPYVVHYAKAIAEHYGFRECFDKLKDIKHVSFFGLPGWSGEKRALQLLEATIKKNNVNYSAEMNDPPLVTQQMNKEEASIDSPDYHGITPLMAAAMNSQIDQVKFLISQGAKIDLRCNLGNTALHYAANESIAQYLISQGGKVNAINYAGNTPLHIAAEKNNATLIHYLIDNGAEINTLNYMGETPVFLAFSQNSTSAVEALVKKGAGIGIETYNQCTIIGLKNRKTPPELIKVLMKTHCTLENDRFTTLHFAVHFNQREDIIRLIKENPDDLSATSVLNQYTPLNIAIVNANFDVFKLLLEMGATLDIKSEHRISTLAFAEKVLKKWENRGKTGQTQIASMHKIIEHIKKSNPSMDTRPDGFSASNQQNIASSSLLDPNSGSIVDLYQTRLHQTPDVKKPVSQIRFIQMTFLQYFINRVKALEEMRSNVNEKHIAKAYHNLLTAIDIVQEDISTQTYLQFPTTLPTILKNLKATAQNRVSTIKQSYPFDNKDVLFILRDTIDEQRSRFGSAAIQHCQAMAERVNRKPPKSKQITPIMNS